MGAKQRAPKRGKAARGSQKGTPVSQRKLNTSMHVPDLDPSTRSNALLGWQDFAVSSSPSNRKAFSMGDAARNTERSTLGWGSSKLRDQGISFVSAGTLHQDPEHVRAQEEQVEVNEPMDQTDEQAMKQPDLSGDSNCQKFETTTDLENTDLNLNELEIDSGPEKVQITIDPAERRSSSGSLSSEGEKIVFRGRSKGPSPNISSLNTSKKTSPARPLVKPASRKEDRLAETNAQQKSTFSSQIVASNTAGMSKVLPIPIANKPVEPPEPLASSSDVRIRNPRTRRRGGRDRRRQSDIDEQEAIMRDYIANMAMEDTDESEAQLQQQQASQEQSRRTSNRKNETFRFYEGAGEENMKVQVLSATPKSQKPDFDQALDWNSDDLKDFDDLSTTDDEVVEVSQVLRYRERTSGPQYLVTPGGLGASEAKWVLHQKLISESATKEIAIFDEIQAMEFDEDDSLDVDDDDDDDDEDEDETTDEEVEEALNDLIDHIESEDDENERIMKYTAKMSDEQIARALAKQEELGMGGDELVLFSGDIEEDEEEPKIDMDDVFGRNDNFISFSLKKHTSNRGKTKRNRKNRDTFPSAEAFADALDEDPYGGFDVMDFDRPSLRPKKKGRKSDFPYELELEDEDLRESLISTWTKDRDKKLQRKLEREEARQTQLLEFADNGDPAAIKAQIRQFLVQEVDTLRLSPMESATRASVHRLAKALRLNSRSEGKDGTAKGRYPVLTKTVRTPSYTIDNIWEIDALLNTRKFFPKGMHKKEKIPRGAARSMNMRRSGGGGGLSGATYMNGEVVGASAPELGADNKGRAMLEKMGWTTGMAIGAEGNKGSLEAVKHVFKVSRAGLG